MELGKTTWLIPDGYWPEEDGAGHYVSHEAICVLNMAKQDANIYIALYFEDEAPMGGFHVVCPAQRTRHIRMDALRNDSGNPVPRGKAYAMVVNCDIPVVVQYSRLDTTQSNCALMTTMAYPI